MESRLEKRIKSIRSLPQGQFNKYRQMFDSLVKTRCREKCKEMISCGHKKDDSHEPSSPPTLPPLPPRQTTVQTIKYANGELKSKLVTTESNDRIQEELLLLREKKQQQQQQQQRHRRNHDIINESKEFVVVTAVAEEKENQTTTPPPTTITTRTTTTKSNSSILSLPYTDDEKSEHLRVDPSSSMSSSGGERGRMSSSFEGISDETNLLLNSICSSNQQIAEFFFDRSTIMNNNHNSTSNDISSSAIVSSSSLSSLSPLTTTTTTTTASTSSMHKNMITSRQPRADFGVYKAVPVMSPIHMVKQASTVCQPDDSIVTFIIENDSVKEEPTTSNRPLDRIDRHNNPNNQQASPPVLSATTTTSTTTSCQDKKFSSLSSTASSSSLSSSQLQNHYHLFSSTLSTVLTTNNYLDLEEDEEVDYSDDDDDDDDVDSESNNGEEEILSDDDDNDEESLDQNELVLGVDDHINNNKNCDDDDDGDETMPVNETVNVANSVVAVSTPSLNSFVSSSQLMHQPPPPPPKPARTFEHDLYISGKSDLINASRTASLERRSERAKSLDLKALPSLNGSIGSGIGVGIGCSSSSSDYDIVAASSSIRPGKYFEHIYETLQSVDQLSLDTAATTAAVATKPNNINSSRKENLKEEEGGENTTTKITNNKPILRRRGFVNFSNLVVAKSDLDEYNDNDDNNNNTTKLNYNNKKDANKQSNLSKSKLAHSEPNLSQIGRGNKKPRNENIILKPFGRFLNTLKKTLSRKNVFSLTSSNSEDSSSSSASSSSASCDPSIGSREMTCTTTTNNTSSSHLYLKRLSALSSSTGSTSGVGVGGVELRNRNSTNLNEKFITKSYIYSEPSELNAALGTLFDYVLVVGLQEHKTCSTDQLNLYEYFSKLTPIVLWKYPDDVPNMNTAIPEFCFPDPSSRTEYKKNETEIFQFTLTNIDAARTYGYCIRICQKSKNPIVICIISQIDALEMYYTVLIEAAKLYKSGMNDLKQFLSAIYHKSFPNRGESLVKKEIVLNRCIDRRLEHINLYTILNYPFDFIIDIFEALLSEKKIIFLSNKLSLLSSTIQAFETLLYPFNWPHTYIPVLPSYLIEMCDAPTPYIIGLMRSCKSDLAKYRGCSSDMLIVDLDKQRFVYDTATPPPPPNQQQQQQQQQRILPDPILKSLKIDLYNLIHSSTSTTTTTSSQQQQLSSSPQYDKNVELCRIFLKVFVRTIGHYANFIVVDQNNSNEFTFLYKEFINEAKSIEIRRFLDYFTKTQLFEVFIVKKLTPGVRFGIMFDDAIRKDELSANRHSLVNAVSSPKATTIRQLSIEI